MEQQPNKHRICLGVLAHVDAGKTTLCEALLYRSGARRTLGRVDHRDTFLDTHALERTRGITIFSKQALFSTARLDITLVDTPGHADLASEAERSMAVLDCAVLVISGTDGVQAHTLTLWRLLERYNIPVFLFINKMDLPGADKQALTEQLQTHLHPGCTDFGQSPAAVAEAAALCDETLLEQYLETGTLCPADVRQPIANRKLFPCCFGAGLKLEGVDDFLDILDQYAPRPVWTEDFGGRVYKISRDLQGNRLTWLKLTGGSLQVRQSLAYPSAEGQPMEEKIVQLRLYAGDRFTAPDRVLPGQLCAITGLTGTYAGQAIGTESAPIPPALEPVMTYRIRLPQGTDPTTALQQLRQLEEEDPQLHLMWDPGSQQIHAQIMGKIQLEVLSELIAQRFHMAVTFDNGRIFYKETITAPVRGVGHFEPLRHYAEVHLLLEPLPRGSGLVFDTACPTDLLPSQYQHLVMSHLSEKTHLGVLTGSPITDMKITLLAGRAHVKHTEGGDFRQATYRAVRQGLMQANSQLLEPWYRMTLTLPIHCVGRAITDIRTMGGQADGPQSVGQTATVTGIVPAASLGDYAHQVATYTQGTGQLQIALLGYLPCHNSQQVVQAADYDPQADIENTPDSVFCDHGAGFVVKWDQVHRYMHLDTDSP